MSRWTDFVRTWAKENNTSYACAMSDSKMKEEYYKKFPKQTKEQKKEQKKEDEEKMMERTLRSSTINFRNKFVRPYLKDKDPVLFNDMINKYRKFSQRLKDFIKEKAPKIHEVVSKSAEQKDERQRKKGLMKPKPEPKKEEPKKPEVKKEEPKQQRQLTEIEKIRKRIEEIENKKGFFMNPNQKKELKKLLDEREKLREKLNKLLKKKIEKLDKKPQPEPKPAKKPEPKKEISRKYRYDFDLVKKDIQDDYMDIEDLMKKNKKLLSNIYISRIGFKKGDPLIPDTNYFLYLDRRMSTILSGDVQKRKRQAVEHYLSQVKSVIKQVKNLSIDDRDIYKRDKKYKQIKARELSLLVPIK